MTKYRSQNPDAAAARQKKMKKSPKRQKRNPFACAGWGRFIMRSVRADEASRQLRGLASQPLAKRCTSLRNSI
jgi:hypothetical protein